MDWEVFNMVHESLFFSVTVLVKEEGGDGSPVFGLLMQVSALAGSIDSWHAQQHVSMMFLHFPRSLSPLLRTVVHQQAHPYLLFEPVLRYWLPGLLIHGDQVVAVQFGDSHAVELDWQWHYIGFCLWAAETSIE
jgi:hypothetical protein